MGLFSTDWSTLFHWDNHAFAVVVGAAPCSMGDVLSIGPTLAWNLVGGAASPTVAGAGQAVGVDTFVCLGVGPFEPFPSAPFPHLDLEIYDPNGVQVLQTIIPLGVPTSPTTRSNEAHTTYNIPVNPVRGTYTVKVGIFSGDWSTLFKWDNQAATFTPHI